MGNCFSLMYVCHLMTRLWRRALGALCFLMQEWIISHETHTSPYVSEDQRAKGELYCWQIIAMCLFNISNKSAAAFRRAAWRPGAVKPDNGPKHCWLIITPGFTVPCLSVNSRGLFFLFFSPLCSCWHYILQGIAQANLVCDLQKTQPNLSSHYASQLH